MKELDQKSIRKAFVNSSKSKAASATFPGQWPPARLDDLDFLGWTDPKAPQRAYLALGSEIVPELVAIELRLADRPGGPRKTMCDWCHTQDAGGARLMVAPRAGARGRAGDTVGLYVCSDFECSLRARTPLKEHQISVSGRPDLRVDELVGRVREFAGRVLGE